VKALSDVASEYLCGFLAIREKFFILFRRRSAFFLDVDLVSI
jgi:hypothetical protein